MRYIYIKYKFLYHTVMSYNTYLHNFMIVHEALLVHLLYVLFTIESYDMVQ